VRSGGSKAFGLWSKCFAGISDSRVSGVGGGESSCENNCEDNYENSCENGGESSRAIITTVFRLSFRYFSSHNITRSFLVISI
jgi:hypothetical protein